MDGRGVECYVVRAEYPKMPGFPNSKGGARTVWVDAKRNIVWRDIWDGQVTFGTSNTLSHVLINYAYSLVESDKKLADDLFMFQPPDAPPVAAVPSNGTGRAGAALPPVPNLSLPNYGDPLGKFAPPGITQPLSNGTGSGGGIGASSGRPQMGSLGVTKPILLHKVEPEFSEQARKAKYQGTVTLTVVVNENGDVKDARVIKSLGLGLDEKAIEAVNKWKFRPGEKDGKPVAVTATIQVNFRLLQTIWTVRRAQFSSAGAPTIDSNPQNPWSVDCSGQGSVTIGLTVGADGVPAHARVLRTTDILANEAALAAINTLRFKPALQDGKPVESEGEIELACAAPKLLPVLPQLPTPPLGGAAGGVMGAGPRSPQAAQAAGSIEVPAAVEGANLVRGDQPAYPELALQARISGAVELEAIIAKDGTVEELSVLNGHPLLREAALAAVKKWVYQPTLLNGQPVKVRTTIDVIFTLAK